MKKISLLLFMLLSAFYYSQADFKSGYFINENNQKVECLIRDYDWPTVPSQIRYKMSENSEVLTINFDKMKAFQIFDTPHYYQKDVIAVDRSTENPNVNLTPETVVVQVLIDGSASLFTDNKVYFYQVGNEEKKQLVQKQYLEGSAFRTDNWFRKDLKQTLSCGNMDARIEKLGYDKLSLTRFFKNYNECADTSYVDYTSINRTKTKVNMKVAVGAGFHNNFSADVKFRTESAGQWTKTQDYKTDPNLVIGAEFEVILPFSHENWGVIFTPVYQSIKGRSTETYYNQFSSPYSTFVPSMGETVHYHTYNFELSTENKYSYLELPVGVRKYFHLNNQSKVFVDGSAGLLFSMSETEEKYTFTEINGNPDRPYIRLDKHESSQNRFTFFKIGAGYMFNKKYLISANYYLRKEIYNSSGSSISLLFSYKLF